MIEKRKRIAEIYRKELEGIKYLTDKKGVKHNYQYFPILIDSKKYGRSRDEIYEELKKNNIFSRRYFYPLISQFPTYRGLPSANAENLPVAEKVTREVLCLPIYPDLGLDKLKKIIEILKPIKA